MDDNRIAVDKSVDDSVTVMATVHAGAMKPLQQWLTPNLTLLMQGLDLLTQDEAPSTFDFERALLGLGATPTEAELLADYIPTACGRAFCRELGMIPSETYQRYNKDGVWGRCSDSQTTSCGGASRVSPNHCASIQEGNSA